MRREREEESKNEGINLDGEIKKDNREKWSVWIQYARREAEREELWNLKLCESEHGYIKIDR